MSFWVLYQSFHTQIWQETHGGIESLTIGSSDDFNTVNLPMNNALENISGNLFHNSDGLVYYSGH